MVWGWLFGWQTHGLFISGALGWGGCVLLRVMQWISPSPGVSGFSFFPVSVCGLSLEEF